MTDGIMTVIAIGIAIAIGQLLSKRFFKPTPKQEIVERTTSGDPIRDYLDNF